MKMLIPLFFIVLSSSMALKPTQQDFCIFLSNYLSGSAKIPVASETRVRMELQNGLKRGLLPGCESYFQSRFAKSWFQLISTKSRFARLFHKGEQEVLESIFQSKRGEEKGLFIESPYSPFGLVYLKWVEANQTYDKFLDVTTSSFGCVELDASGNCFIIDLFQSFPVKLVERKTFKEKLIYDISHIANGNYYLRLRWHTGEEISPAFSITHALH